MDQQKDKKSLLNSHNASQLKPNNQQSFQMQFKRQIANMPYDEQVKAIRPNKPFGHPGILEEIEAKKAEKNKLQNTQKTAEKGLADSETKLPFKEELEQAFQRDFSNVKAHTGPQATEANQKLGSEAYTSGNRIVFGNDNPSKKLVAHELAHTVQQQAGVQLNNGVGESGDSYEQNADVVADRVSEGKPVKDLPGTSTNSSNSKQVQKKEETNHLDLLDDNTIISNEESINSPVFAMTKGTQLFKQ